MIKNSKKLSNPCEVKCPLPKSLKYRDFQVRICCRGYANRKKDAGAYLSIELIFHFF